VKRVCTGWVISAMTLLLAGLILAGGPYCWSAPSGSAEAGNGQAAWHPLLLVLVFTFLVPIVRLMGTRRVPACRGMASNLGFVLEGTRAI
jgi:hypothetical protein